MKNDPTGAAGEAMPADPATVEALAAMEWKPWPTGPAHFQPLTDREWTAEINPTLISVRIAFAMLTRTKADMVEAVAGLIEDGAMEDTLARLSDARGFFLGHVRVMEAAMARVLAAMTLAGGPDDAGTPERTDEEMADLLRRMTPHQREVAKAMVRLASGDADRLDGMPAEIVAEARAELERGDR